MLVGKVSEADGQMRIIVRLLKCRTQACVWAESYTQPKEDLFANQAEISRKIASSIIQSIPISIRPSHLGAVPASVYETYLQGMFAAFQALGRCTGSLHSPAGRGGSGVSPRLRLPGPRLPMLTAWRRGWELCHPAKLFPK